MTSAENRVNRDWTSFPTKRTVTSVTVAHILASPSVVELLMISEGYSNLLMSGIYAKTSVSSNLR